MIPFRIVSIGHDTLVQDLKDELADKYDLLIDQDQDFKIDTFKDGSCSPQFLKKVRGEKVFIVCTTHTHENLMRLFLTIDAAKRASADEIIAVVPYYGYSRQAKKEGVRGPGGAKLIADLLSASGIDRLITFDLHADQIQLFFNNPVDHISGSHVFYPIIKNMINVTKQIKNPTILSPDAGGVKRADKLFKKLSGRMDNVEFAMFSKMRIRPNEVARMDLIGDVKGRDVIIIDDLIDTGGTLCKAADNLIERGASSVRAFITHGVLSDGARENITNSKIDQLIITDTIPIDPQLAHDIDCGKENKITITSVRRMLGKVVNTVVQQHSLHSEMAES